MKKRVQTTWQAVCNSTGWLIDSAIAFVEQVFPAPAFESQVQSMHKASLDYAAHGITSRKNAFVTRDEMLLMQATAERGLLTIRLRPMIGLAFADPNNRNGGRPH